jgi:NadR type nicotinamide-nucleotide adenylyltransferase
MEKKFTGDISKMIRVAVTGPESTGKSTLAEGLARHFETVYNPEYAREYLDKINRPYTYEDIEKIARLQLQKEKKLIKSAIELIIADTDFIVIKVWMEYKYNKCPEWIKDEIINNPYDLYFLCDIDIPWEPDPLREHPDLRGFFMDIYKKELAKLNVKFRIISGNQTIRLKKAIAEIELLKASFTC